VNRDRENLLRSLLTDHEFFETVEDFARRRNAVEELTPSRAATSFLLIEDRLAKFDALAADVNVAGPLNERSDLSIALSAEGAMSVLAFLLSRRADLMIFGHWYLLSLCVPVAADLVTPDELSARVRDGSSNSLAKTCRFLTDKR
jgi:hypothetical protein